MTVCFIASTTHTSPPFSAVTYARELSGRKAVERGRRPTLNVLIGLSAIASMAVTWLSSSDVTTRPDRPAAGPPLPARRRP